MPGSDQFGGAVDKLKDKAREYLGGEKEEEADEEQNASGEDRLDEAKQTGEDAKENAEQEADEIRDRF